jgi:hypothetical protein
MPTIVRVERHADFTMFKMTLPDSERNCEVSVWHSQFENEPTFDVNWSALGSCSPIDAAAYARLLADAAAYAADKGAGHDYDTTEYEIDG